MSRKKTKTQIPKFVIDDKDINDLHGIRTTFNSYFSEIGPTLGLASKINPPRVSFEIIFSTPSHTNFELIPKTVDEVSKLVANLSTNKADNLDRIPARLPKALCPFSGLLDKRSSRLTRRQTQLIIGQYQLLHGQEKTL